MKSLKTLAALLLGACATLFVGCGTTQHAYDPVNPPQPYAFPGQSAAATPTQTQLPGPTIANPNPVVIPHSTAVPSPSASAAHPAISGSTLRGGDVVMLSFTDIPGPIVDQRLQIAEDGTL